MNSIELRLQNLNKRETVFLYAIVVLLLVYIFLQYVFPQVEVKYNISNSEIHKLKTKINENKILQASVKSDGKSSVFTRELEMKLEKLKEELNYEKDKTKFLDHNLRELSKKLSTDVSWTGLIDEVSTFASKNSVKIVSIKNSYFEQKKDEVDKVITIEIDIQSSFENLLELVRCIENQNLILTFDELLIKSSDKNGLDSKIVVSIWGLKYL